MQHHRLLRRRLIGRLLPSKVPLWAESGPDWLELRLRPAALALTEGEYEIAFLPDGVNPTR